MPVLDLPTLRSEGFLRLKSGGSGGRSTTKDNGTSWEQSRLFRDRLNGTRVASSATVTRLLGHRLSRVYIHTYVVRTDVGRPGAACLRVQIRFAYGSQFSRNRTLRRDRHTVCTHRYRPMPADTAKRNNAWKGRPRNALPAQFAARSRFDTREESSLNGRDEWRE